MTNDEKRARIRMAMTYRRGHYYMGSMARSELMRIFGIPYGSPGFDRALDLSGAITLDTALRYCGPYLKFIDEHPMHECPTCGTMVDDKR